MEDGPARLVGDGPQDLGLGLRGVGQHGQGLVRVGRDHHVIEGHRAAALGGQLDAIGVTRDRADRASMCGSGRRTAWIERVHVAVGAALDGAPLGPVEEVEHPVVVEEAGEEPGGELVQVARIGGPDGGHLRHDQALDERVRVAAVLEELREAGRGPVRADPGPQVAVEAAQVEDHPVEGRAHQVRALGVEAVGRAARVLEVVHGVAHREAHARRLVLDPEAVQEPLEVRVVPIVEDDEPGVDSELGIPGLAPCTVLVWPPIRSSASNTVISCSRWSR